VGLALSLLASAFMAGGAGASQTKNYAYLFVQGRLSDPGSKTAMAGAQIRLTSGESSFEATTDPKGNFAFEKLPVATYLVHITTADGRVLERIEDMGLTLTGPKRYRASFAHGPEAIPVIVASDKDVSVTVPKPTVRWKRFWTQFAIFAGGALVLAL
jgi:hypothetical protein